MTARSLPMAAPSSRTMPWCNKAEAGAIWAKEMNVLADLAGKIGQNNAVPTRGVSDADVAQIGKIAEWYAKRHHSRPAGCRVRRRVT